MLIERKRSKRGNIDRKDRSFIDLRPGLGLSFIRFKIEIVLVDPCGTGMAL